MISALVMIVTLSLLGPSVANLAVSFRADNLQVARNLAESSVAVAMHQLASSTSFGSQGTETVTADNAPPGTIGVVTFTSTPVPPINQQAPTSTYNLTGSSNTTGTTGRTIPNNSIDFVGYGASGPSSAVLEVIMQMPLFAYPVTSTGSMSTDGPVVVGSVNQLGDLANGVNQSTLLPGSLVANNSGGISMTSQKADKALILGDLVSTGSIDDKHVDLRGTKLANQSTAEGVPSISTTPSPDISSSSPSGVNSNALGTSPSNPAALTGYNFQSGSVSVTGDLQLSTAALLVDGDLTVSGTITGTGAVYVKGKVSFNGGSTLQTSGDVAIVSTGDASITGSGQSTSFFTGLIYTKGNFSSSDVTIAGAVVQDKSSGSATLKNTTVILVPNLPLTFQLSPSLTVYAQPSTPIFGGSSTRIILWEFL